MGITFGSAYRKTIGKILAADIFQEGAYVDRSTFGIARSTKPSLSTQLNFVFESLKEDGTPAARKDGLPEKNQQEWIGLSGREDSAMAALLKHLDEIGSIDPTTVMAPTDYTTDDEFAEALALLAVRSMVGKVFVLEQQNVGKKVGKPTWMPIKVISDLAPKPATDAALPGSSQPGTPQAGIPAGQIPV